jgi:hypothetical protein
LDLRSLLYVSHENVQFEIIETQKRKCSIFEDF